MLAAWGTCLKSARSMLDELRGYGFIPTDDDKLATLPHDALDRRLDMGIVFRYLRDE